MEQTLMPQLDEKDYAEFSRILEELTPEINNMKETPAGFVRDQITRNNQYGERTLVSPKQFNWLKQLHEEFVGDTQHDKAEDGPDPNDPRFH